MQMYTWGYVTKHISYIKADFMHYVDLLYSQHILEQIGDSKFSQFKMKT